MSEVVEQIRALAANSPLRKYGWIDRGRAPRGYIAGMALCYARLSCDLKRGEIWARAMASEERDDPGRDALWWYRDQFSAAGLSNASDGRATLRNLLVLLTGLGMRESSGKHCEGRDMSAENVSGETAEAGLFQVSYNSMRAGEALPAIYERYKDDADGFRSVFSAGVTCSENAWKNWGDEPGRTFQKRMKQCPALAVEYAALGLRLVRKHWGPINRRKAELRAEAVALFDDVEALLASSGVTHV